MIAPTRLRHSLSVALGLVALAISLLALASMLATVYLTDTVRGDAQAINRAGSLRMQVWRLVAMAQTDDVQNWTQQLAAVDTTYRHLETSPLIAASQTALAQRLQALHADWQHGLRPALATPALTRQVDMAHIAAHVMALDTLVGRMQATAEQRLRRLRGLQLTLLALTLPLIGYGGYRLFRHVLVPLRRLMGVVEALRAGQLNARSAYWRDDEIGLLAATIDDMAGQLDRLYRSLEDRVEDQSHRLQESRLALRLLYANARYLAATPPDKVDYQKALTPFDALLAPATLTLLTGETPLAQGAGVAGAHRLCFPLRAADTRFGTLVALQPDGAPLPAWKRQICETVADHLRTAMARQAHTLHQRRLALMDERAVIARELHDSLAQALSYLNIQALRLQRQLATHHGDEACAIVAELREGIDHAYRQLRELLVTFRLRLTEQGINTAIAATVEEFAARGQLAITHQGTLSETLLSPDEELHLVQILREALSNVVQHAHARQVQVTLAHRKGCVTLRIEDDGIGLPADQHRPDHYGITIMQERANSLNGTLRLFSRPAGGACVELTFTPGHAQGHIS